jgi:ABC-type transport system involved in multi-copper enzyme maturation permease subunit
MTFLIWRLHRAHAIVAAVVIAAVTALIVPSGIAIANSYHHAVMNCSVNHVGCGDIGSIVFGSNGVFTSLVQDLAMAFPLVLGILWGAPLVAGEFEAGTEDIAWTQGVTRGRWVLTNLGWALLVAAAWGGALAALFTWWRGPDNAVDGPVKFIYFDIQGVAPIAYAVFAMALGIAAGALFRRVVPAITTTLVAFLAVRIVTALVLRPQFAVAKNVSPLAGVPPLSWSISADILPSAAASTACANAAKGPQGLSCLAAHGAYEHITYLPASRFWSVQGAESGIFLVLALALAIFTYWSVTTREA